MAALCVGGWLHPAALFGGRLIRSLALGGLLAAPAAASAIAPAQPIVVHVDQARIIRLPDKAATIVIGNPLIADLSLQPGGIAVVTGKGYGATNVIVMDRSGAVLMEKSVEVKGPTDKTVVVYRGLTKQTYSCNPQCDPRVTLGDTSKDDFDKETGLPTDYFGKTLSQTVNRDAQATAAASRH